MAEFATVVIREFEDAAAAPMINGQAPDSRFHKNRAVGVQAHRHAGADAVLVRKISNNSWNNSVLFLFNRLTSQH
jgi:hypothetical protein